MLSRKHKSKKKFSKFKWKKLIEAFKSARPGTPQEAARKRMRSYEDSFKKQ